MTITDQDLAAALRTWGDGVCAISRAYISGGLADARAAAEELVDGQYGYRLGPVLFKPTLASGAQRFRPTRRGALAYFVGHDADFPLDAGFALMGWRAMESRTASVFADGAMGLWMGRVRFLGTDGQVIEVDKSLGFKRDAKGVLRIVLHHSSLPYQP